jgi:protocatechuate 3,4-dioxygenase beta subunit
MLVLVLVTAMAVPQVKPPARDARPPASAAQPAGKGAISGTVVSADRGQPVQRARVVLNGGSPKVTRSFQTDEQGAFRFTDLPDGEFTLTASKGGYVDSVFGQRQPGSGRPGTPIHLLADQQITKVSLPLARGGVITGAVYDDAGEPAFEQQVRLLRWVMKSGERTLENTASVMTDDRGVYRFSVLRPGDYVVATAPSLSDGQYDFEPGTYFKLVKANGGDLASTAITGKVAITFDRGVEGATGPPPATGFASAFYPGTRDVSGAMSVSVGVGEERSGIDFHLQLVPIGRISGLVTGPDGPVAGVEVQLADRGQPAGVGVRSARAGKDGVFTFNGVAPGQYAVFANATTKTAKAETAFTAKAPASDPQTADQEKKRMALANALADSADLWAMTEVSGDGHDLEGVSLVLQPGLTISGHVLAETGSGAPPNLGRLMIAVERVGQSPNGDRTTPPPAVVDANGDFAVRGVFPGRYRIALAEGAPAGYAIRSAIFGGRDVMDQPLVLGADDRPAGGLVTLSNRTTEISGTVQDSSGQPAPGVTLIVFSADERFWLPESRRIQATRPSTEGRYTFKNLPPGEYRLAAVEDIEPGRWFDPTFLRGVGGFLTVTVTDGGRATQDVRIK